MVTETCNPHTWVTEVEDCRLALTIEWDHVSKTKTKQKTSRKISPLPSLHPQRYSFNPLYEDLALRLLSLQVLSSFHLTLIRYRPSTHYPPGNPKVTKVPKFFSIDLRLQVENPTSEPMSLHTEALKTTRNDIEAVCVRCKWNVNSCVQTWAPSPVIPCCAFKYCNIQKEKKLKTYLVSSISDKEYSVCITGPITSCSIWQLQRTMGSLL